MKRGLASIGLLFLSACVSEQSLPSKLSTGPMAPTSVAVQPTPAPGFFISGLSAYRSNGWDTLLTAAIDDLGQDLLAAVPSDVADYCPGYATMPKGQRQVVWENLLVALTRYESNYSPSVSFNETNVNPGLVERNGDPVISRGLLQLSRESANSYGCAIGVAEELHNPATNLRCAVRIASRWVKKDGVIAARSSSGWRGMARYWSPFRAADRLQNIQKAVRSTPGC